MTHRGSTSHARTSRGVLAPAISGIVMLLATLFLPACGQPLFSPDEPRSQYDRNDALRGQHAPSYVYDQYGTRRPNIRQRLLDTPD